MHVAAEDSHTFGSHKLKPSFKVRGPAPSILAYPNLNMPFKNSKSQEAGALSEF